MAAIPQRVTMKDRKWDGRKDFGFFARYAALDRNSTVFLAMKSQGGRGSGDEGAHSVGCRSGLKALRIFRGGSEGLGRRIHGEISGLIPA
jgi:hypothetical protein